MPSCLQTFNQAIETVNSHPYQSVNTPWMWLCSIGYKGVILRWQFVQPLAESVIEAIHDGFLAFMQMIIVLSSGLHLFSHNQHIRNQMSGSIVDLYNDIIILYKSALGILIPSFYDKSVYNKTHMQLAPVFVRKKG